MAGRGLWYNNPMYRIVFSIFLALAAGVAGAADAAAPVAATNAAFRCGFTVADTEAEGSPRVIRRVISEMSRNRLDTLVWKLRPGTNRVFAVMDDTAFKRIAYFAWKHAVTLVPALDLRCDAAVGRETVLLERLCGLTPAKGMPFVELGPKPLAEWPQVLVRHGRAAFATVENARLEPAPKLDERQTFTVPAEVAARLSRRPGQ